MSAGGSRRRSSIRPVFRRRRSPDGDDRAARADVAARATAACWSSASPLHETDAVRRAACVVIELDRHRPRRCSSPAPSAGCSCAPGLRPLRRVERTALRIADGGDLDLDVPGSGRPTEVGRLAGGVEHDARPDPRVRSPNATRRSAALRDSEQRMRRFVADVSHELRTPLAAVAAYAELFERGAALTPADLDRAMHGIGLESRHGCTSWSKSCCCSPTSTRAARWTGHRRLGRPARRCRRPRTDGRPRAPVALQHLRGRHRDRRCQPAAPGDRQPAGQRADAHPAGHHHTIDVDDERSRGRPRRRRQRSRDATDAEPRVRALLPSRPVAVTPVRRRRVRHGRSSQPSSRARRQVRVDTAPGNGLRVTVSIPRWRHRPGSGEDDDE